MKNSRIAMTRSKLIEIKPIDQRWHRFNFDLRGGFAIFAK